MLMMIIPIDLGLTVEDKLCVLLAVLLIILLFLYRA